MLTEKDVDQIYGLQNPENPDQAIIMLCEDWRELKSHNQTLEKENNAFKIILNKIKMEVEECREDNCFIIKIIEGIK